MQVDRIGDPFVPRSLEGVCVHVRVRSPEGARFDVRVVILHRSSSPSASGHDSDAASAAARAVAEDMRRRQDAYGKVFDELERKRAEPPRSRP